MNNDLGIVLQELRTMQPADVDDMQTRYEKLLREIDDCLAASENSPLKDDLLAIQDNLIQYNKITEANTTYADAEKTYCLIRSKRIIKELALIVLNNDHPLEYSEAYLGVTSFLNGDAIEKWSAEDR
jgi:hypothetical protein